MDTTDSALWKTSNRGLTGYQADEKRSEDEKELHYYIESLEEMLAKEIKLELVGEINVWVVYGCGCWNFLGRDFFSSAVPVSSDKGGKEVLSGVWSLKTGEAPDKDLPGLIKCRSPQS